MSEPVRITKNATATDLVESIGWLGEEIQKRAEAQARKDVADALRDTFVDRSHTLCTHTMTTQDSIIEAMALSKETQGRRFSGVADRFDNEGVPSDFQLGIEFAIAMIRDSEFEL